MRTLIVDACTAGFMKYVEKRLRLMGYTVLYPRVYWVDDDFLHMYARKVGGVVVTMDKGFPEPKILITKNKYEEAWTELCRQLRRMRETVSEGDVSCPPRQVPITYVGSGF